MEQKSPFEEDIVKRCCRIKRLLELGVEMYDDEKPKPQIIGDFIIFDDYTAININQIATFSKDRDGLVYARIVGSSGSSKYLPIKHQEFLEILKLMTERRREGPYR